MEMSAMSVMSDAIGEADKAMIEVMKGADMKKMNDLVRDFAKNMGKMNDRQENMAEMMDEVFEGDGCVLCSNIMVMTSAGKVLCII